MNIPTFKTKKELFDHLVKNKALLIAERKSMVKHADCVSFRPTKEYDREGADKGMPDEMEEEMSRMKVNSVINTTNILDSHGDVHLDGIWNKSVKENKNLFLIKEHRMNFENVISDEVKAAVKTIQWSELGYSYEGKTQALIFTSLIDKDTNPYMFDKYAKGKVKNHSVGMRYVSLSLGINDDRYKEEYDVWKKYINKVVNKSEAEEQGYAWFIHEAKIIEGSAVLVGSNQATPTLSVESKFEPPAEGTQQTEPDLSTQKQKINYSFLTQNFNNL